MQRHIWWTLSLDCCNKNRLKPSNLASWNSIDCEWESRTVTVNIRQKAEIAWIGVEELETDVRWGRCFLFLGFPSCIVIWWAVIVWNDDVVLLNGVVGECDG